MVTANDNCGVGDNLEWLKRKNKFRRKKSLSTQMKCIVCMAFGLNNKVCVG